MRVTWLLVILGVLGLLAAFAAAILLIAVRGFTQVRQAVPTGEARETTVLVAASDLPAAHMLDSGNIAEKKMKPSSAPRGSYSEVSALLGRVLAVPVVEGQALTDRLLVREGTGAHLAGMLPAGMRAVTVTLSEYEGLGDLIYPGCLVDVLASFKLDSREAVGEALSTTLLENVQVLAVEDQTVGSGGQSETDEAVAQGPKVRRADRRLMVSLMVTPEQAESLQLALQYGTVSLTMRNPEDRLATDGEPTLLQEGQLAAFAKAMAAVVERDEELKRLKERAAAAEAAAEAAKAEAGAKAEGDKVEEQKPRQVEIIRGVEAEMQPLGGMAKGREGT